MRQADLILLLHRIRRDHGKRVFSLRDIAALAGVSRPAAGMALLAAEKRGLVGRATTLWVNLIDPPPLSELALAFSSPSYISFESALYHHHVLSQSPRGELTLATRGRSKRLSTPLGSIRFIHVKQSLFFGFDENRMALPEKAWLDLLYIRRRMGMKPLLTERFYPERLNRRRLALFSKRAGIDKERSGRL
ncbi:MAG: hypothetical protein Q7T11_04600 [Deltaproteobacteria bacterium]|nr:hypothetical protein [Deltaproteobacteria bacterium]